MTTPRTIAVLRTDRLGDMVLTLPMFPALRSRFPDARLILIASRYVEPLVRSVDVIDEVVYLDAPNQHIGPILREYAVDTLFAPRPRLSEAWQALRSGVRRRIGSGFRWYSPLYNVRIHEHRSDAAYHEAEYNVRMIMHAFGGSMPNVELVSPRTASPKGTHRARPRIIVHPGSGGSAKDWPAERFGMAARALHDELGAEIIITGIASERSLCDEVATHCPRSTNLCGTLDLDGMIDLIAEADVLMANSTGVLHVATAVSTPVVGFFPSTPSMSARRWGPYSKRAVVLESGPGDDMLTIGVQAAVDATKRLLTGS
ncbi:MAG: glycosyltransferase family 9 protein [Candidatus Kapabacteria bacterium]|nr:glycosyltransferase family 9 protein [Candidatus Kapabacteria bacterium]